MIGKLENGVLHPCPKSGLDGSGVMHTNLAAFYEKHADTAAEDGFYSVRYTDKPEGDYLPSWELIGGEIVQVWTPYTPQPEPADPIAERLDFIEDCLLEMSEAVYG